MLSRLALLVLGLAAATLSADWPYYAGVARVDTLLAAQADHAQERRLTRRRDA